MINSTLNQKKKVGSYSLMLNKKLPSLPFDFQFTHDLDQVPRSSTRDRNSCASDLLREYSQKYSVK